MIEKKYLSRDGFKKFKAELKKLTTQERRQIAHDIAEARAKGDLSENAEYHAAKEAQAHLERKIHHLEKLLSSSQIIDDSKKKNDAVYLFSKVKLLNINTNQEVIYTLVPSDEAHFKSGKLSIHSPIGSALQGKTVGDKVCVDVPAGQMAFKILSIG